MPETASDSLRQRKKLQTRELLFVTALGLFERHGFGGVTVEEIAAAADVSPRTFFRYFPSKEDVLFAKSDDAIEVIGGSFAAAAPDEPLTDVIVRSLEDLAALHASHSEDALRAGRFIMNEPALMARGMQQQFRWEQTFARLVGQHLGIAADSLTAMTIAANTMATIRVCKSRWLEGASNQQEMPELDEAFSVLFDGISTISNKQGKQ